jgi:hypothetical protein
MHQLVRMGEMREKIYPNLPHLPHLHSRQKDQLLMTTLIQRGLGLWDDFIRIFLM